MICTYKSNLEMHLVKKRIAKVSAAVDNILNF